MQKLRYIFTHTHTTCSTGIPSSAWSLLWAALLTPIASSSSRSPSVCKGWLQHVFVKQPVHTQTHTGDSETQCKRPHVVCHSGQFWDNGWTGWFQVFWHRPGNVILASDLCCKSSLSSLLKMNTLKARCNKPGRAYKTINLKRQRWNQKLCTRGEMGLWYLCQCLSSGGSFSSCPHQSSGHSRQWRCTSPPAAGPASGPGYPLSQTFWPQTGGASPCCRDNSCRCSVHIHIHPF